MHKFDVGYQICTHKFDFRYAYINLMLDIHKFDVRYILIIKRI